MSALSDGVIYLSLIRVQDTLQGEDVRDYRDPRVATSSNDVPTPVARFMIPSIKAPHSIRSVSTRPGFVSFWAPSAYSYSAAKQSDQAVTGRQVERRPCRRRRLVRSQRASQ